jgi:hypothetical protein
MTYPVIGPQITQQFTFAELFVVDSIRLKFAELEPISKRLLISSSSSSVVCLTSGCIKPNVQLSECSASVRVLSSFARR